MRVVTRSSEETRYLGERIGRLLEAGDLICLWGDMGAGKTTMTQGICRGLDVAEPVCSPTFALVQEYAGRLPVWHLDTYRVRSGDELIDLGWSDLLAGGGVVIVEWPERIAEALPTDRLDLHLSDLGGDSRGVELMPQGAGWLRRIAPLESECAAC